MPTDIKYVKNFCEGYLSPKDINPALSVLNKHEVMTAPGSSHNHQNWVGGYLDHVIDCMRIALRLFTAFFTASNRQATFPISSAMLVLFLHDLEKPFRPEVGWENKTRRWWHKQELIKEFGFELTEEEWNAVKYCEGEGDDYSSKKRVMNELAAFCHCCDVLSARVWHTTRFS